MKIKTTTLALTCLIAAAADGEEAAPKAGLLLPSPDALHKAEVETPPSFAAGKDHLPARFSLRDSMPAAGNQGSTNSCVAWSVGYGVLSYLNRDTTPTPRDPIYIYHWARLNQTRRGAPIEDKGCMFQDGFKAIINNGACNFGEYTDFRSEPDRATAEEAHQFRAKLAYPPFELRVSNLDSIKKTLTETGGKPLPAGFRLCQEFHEQTGFEPRTTAENLKTGHSGREVKVWCKAGSPILDSAGRPKDVLHAMLLTGYDDSIRAFEVLNSHGKEWGDHGYAWIDYAFFQSRDAKGKAACCEVVYDYTLVSSGFSGWTDKMRNAFRFFFGASADEWEPEGYCRIATIVSGNSRIRADDLNFEIEPSVEALKALVQNGAELTVKPGIKKLALRADLHIDPASGDTTMGSKIGELKSGDRFKVSDLKKVTLHHGKRIEYWARGIRVE